jgi:hypothetical protein
MTLQARESQRESGGQLWKYAIFEDIGLAQRSRRATTALVLLLSRSMRSFAASPRAAALAPELLPDPFASVVQGLT